MKSLNKNRIILLIGGIVLVLIGFIMAYLTRNSEFILVEVTFLTPIAIGVGWWALLFISYIDKSLQPQIETQQSFVNQQFEIQRGLN